MRHYEIIMIIHPDQSEHISTMIKKYKNLIESDNGKIHRLEELGKRQLAYPIKKLHKAHYLLMNIECKMETLNKLSSLLKFNDAIIRNLIIKQKKIINCISTLKSVNTKSN